MSTPGRDAKLGIYQRDAPYGYLHYCLRDYGLTHVKEAKGELWYRLQVMWCVLGRVGQCCLRHGIVEYKPMEMLHLQCLC